VRGSLHAKGTPLSGTNFVRATFSHKGNMRLYVTH
jgi:hypothetical protein